MSRQLCQAQKTEINLWHGTKVDAHQEHIFYNRTREHSVYEWNMLYLRVSIVNMLFCLRINFWRAKYLYSAYNFGLLTTCSFVKQMLPVRTIMLMTMRKLIATTLTPNKEVITRDVTNLHNYTLLWNFYGGNVDFIGDVEKVSFNYKVSHLNYFT